MVLCNRLSARENLARICFVMIWVQMVDARQLGRVHLLCHVKVSQRQKPRPEALLDALMHASSQRSYFSFNDGDNSKALQCFFLLCASWICFFLKHEKKMLSLSLSLTCMKCENLHCGSSGVAAFCSSWGYGPEQEQAQQLGEHSMCIRLS